MSWSAPKFDKHQFAGRRFRAVAASRRGDGVWDTTGISFADFGSMHVQRREKVQERRLPTPKWAVRDEWLQELLVTHLEERFYIRTVLGSTITERLDYARKTAEAYAPRKRQLLQEWLNDYNVISKHGRADLSDDEAIQAFASLKQINGQLPLNADIAREFLAEKRLHDLEIQIQNIDTDIVLTERGHAEVIASIVYLYYRLGWDSVTCAEQLGLKSPHVRQVLARLHATWTTRLSQRYKGLAGKDQANPEAIENSSGDGPADPLDALFEEETL